MNMNERAGASTYVLGHADTEIQRLLLQGRLYNDLTEHALRLAGLRPGMRVLDVGCGLGDVSFVAARLVGPAGTVLGVDASSDVVEFARARAAERGLTTVKFEQTTIADIAVDEVDAVIGRLILMHSDPISTLRQLAGFVRPGGLIAFCEFDIGAVRSVPDSPLSRALVDAIVRAFQGAGLDPAFGAALHTLFREAGLRVPQLTVAAPVGTPKSGSAQLRYGGCCFPSPNNWAWSPMSSPISKRSCRECWSKPPRRTPSSFCRR